MHAAFREASCVGDCAHTGADGAPFISPGLAVQVQVNEKCGGLLVVPDQIPHQHVEHVIVDGNGLLKAGHGKRMKEELKRMKWFVLPLYR